MFKVLKEAFRTGDVTIRYPFGPLPASPPDIRGKPQYDPERCMACAACTIACPSNALTMKTDTAAGTRTWQLNFGQCIFCARCEEVCPTRAIVLSAEYELAVMNRADLYQTAEFRLEPCRACGTAFAPQKEIDYVISLMVQAGLPEVDAERRREVVATCPACKRYSDASKVGGLSSAYKEHKRRMLP
jgi:formate hydrogenlyase subunit 6/NADH:ubiquinone oxidoreductase subunit I